MITNCSARLLHQFLLTSTFGTSANFTSYFAHLHKPVAIGLPKSRLPGLYRRTLRVRLRSLVRVYIPADTIANITASTIYNTDNGITTASIIYNTDNGIDSRFLQRTIIKRREHGAFWFFTLSII